MKNMNKQILRPTFLVALSALLLIACEKEFDSPPVPSIPEGSVLTVQELRDLFQGNEVRFDSSMSVYGVITADENKTDFDTRTAAMVERWEQEYDLFVNATNSMNDYCRRCCTSWPITYPLW